eukprot:m.320275 g.320275  ORF g.320275 m.320275 type:complete len:92 (+) comp20317_c0_seq15:67-342(+)
MYANNVSDTTWSAGVSVSFIWSSVWHSTTSSPPEHLFFRNAKHHETLRVLFIDAGVEPPQPPGGAFRQGLCHPMELVKEQMTKPYCRRHEP